jgi:hypothetical protein
MYVTGVTDVDGLVIGGGQIWAFPDANAKVGVVSAKAEDLSGLSEALKDKEAMMAAQGARLLEEQKKAAEAAETLKIRNSGEHSVLQKLALSVGSGLQKAITWLCEWAGISGGVSIKLNTEYSDAQMNPQELTALMALWQSSGISHETLYHNLKRGELTRPGVDYEAEKSTIETELPA